MRALRDEGLEALARERDGIGPRDAERVEAVRARGVDERGLEMCGIAQKSRSA
jgi:hypothetical protein